jgi:hypothetical protein
MQFSKANVLVAAIVYTTSCECPQRQYDGIYATPAEVATFYGEILSLHEGRFSYWTYSDFGDTNSPRYPLFGRFRVEWQFIILEDSRITSPRRKCITLNKQRVLFREDALHLWQDRGVLYPGGCMLQTKRRPEEIRDTNRPSISVLISGSAGGSGVKPSQRPE